MRVQKKDGKLSEFNIIHDEDSVEALFSLALASEDTEIILVTVQHDE
jgi:hypothetical protein